MLTDEVASHLATRIGIHNGYALDSDHYPVVYDIPLNCAGAARNVTPVWSYQKVTKTESTGSTQEELQEGVEKFNEALAQGAVDTEGMT